MRHPASWKVELVDKVSKEIDNAGTVAIVDIHGLRNNQFQNIRRDVRGDLNIRVMRLTLLLKAIEKSKKPGLAGLSKEVKGQVALVTTNSEPVSVNNVLRKKRQMMSPRGGETASDDIVVPEGETSFPPGPMISEFQKAGLQTAIEKGKIVIKRESVVVKKGEVISKERASLLQKLDIKPIEVGLNLLAAYSSGTIFTSDVLSITPESLSLDIAMSFARAKTLALEAGFLVPEIIPDMIVKARLIAESLALKAGIVDESSIQLFILKAIQEASAVQEAMDEGKQSSGKESKKEEKEAKSESTDEDVSAGLSSLFG
ncbi:MAG: 50S ribosomal protein L10 [Thermoplasmataceae archaeon]|jgi:large subunit ribosomal protein L10